MIAIVGGYNLVDDRLMANDAARHGGRKLLPHACASLDVGHEESERAHMKLQHFCLCKDYPLVTTRQSLRTEPRVMNCQSEFCDSIHKRMKCLLAQGLSVIDATPK